MLHQSTRSSAAATRSSAAVLPLPSMPTAIANIAEAAEVTHTPGLACRARAAIPAHQQR